MRFLDRLREAVDGADPLVSRGELVNANLVQVTNGALTPGQAIAPISCVTPPAPTNLLALGTMTTVILSWRGDGYNTRCHAATEIYRSTDEYFTDAILIGTTTASIFSDPVGSQAEYYYWARFINVNGLQGPLNAGAGTKGATAPDIPYILDMLVEEYGSDSISPFFQVDQPVDINGQTVPAGTYIKNAFIYNGAIQTAMIGRAAIEEALIADLAVGAAKIQDGAITNLKIGNVIESNDNGITWRIDKRGWCYFRRIRILDLDGRTVFQSGGSINYGYVTGGPPSDADRTSDNIAAGFNDQGQFATLDRITAQTVSTYIEAAAISTAYIADAAIVSAKIASASIKSINLVDGSLLIASKGTSDVYYVSISYLDPRILSTMTFSARQPIRSVLMQYVGYETQGFVRIPTSQGGQITEPIDTQNLIFEFTIQRLGATSSTQLDSTPSANYTRTYTTSDLKLDGAGRFVDFWDEPVSNPLFGDSEWPPSAQQYGLYGAKVTLSVYGKSLTNVAYAYYSGAVYGTVQGSKMTGVAGI
jgi:hypothetical protein